MDGSPECNAVMTQQSKAYIGILRWALELGRVDIVLEVSLMSSFNALPREGHLEAIYHMFAYLATADQHSIVFDASLPDLKPGLMVVATDWTDFLGDVSEAIPPKMPKPRGNPVNTTCFVDANHAGNLVTRRSQTGILIFVMKSPIVWYSKRQNTVETSTFGSEFVAMRQATELIEALRYKLRMFGIPIDGPTRVYGDNGAVISNSSIPTSTLTKKHNAICYHRVREAVAAGTTAIGKVHTDYNLADLFTKQLSPERRYHLLQCITYQTKR
jgi:hypothetical protein